MSELISQYINEQEANRQFTYVINSLGEIEKRMDKINEKGLNIEFALKGGDKDLKQLVELTTDLKVANDELLDAAMKTAKIRDLNASAALKEAKANQISKKETDEYIKSVKAGRAELEKLTREYEKKLKAQMKAEQDAALKEAMKKEAAQAAELRKGLKELNDEIKLLHAETKKEQAEVDKLQSAYARLNKAHKEAVQIARDAGVTYGVESKQFKELSENANVLGNKLKDVDYALGIHNRNVGNYASHWNGLNNAVSQMAREAPAFANSFATGVMAISNNLPILMDELKKVRIENERLMASGLKSVPVWKQVVSSLLSWQTAVIAIVTLLAAYGNDIWKWFTNGAKAAKEAMIANMDLKDSVDKLTDSYKNINKEISRDERLMIARAEAAGKTEEEITKIRQEAITKRKDLINEEIEALIESKGYWTNRLYFVVKNRQMTEKDVEETKKQLEKVQGLLRDAREKREDLNVEEQIVDLELQESKRKKTEEENKKSEAERERYSKRYLDSVQKMNDMELALRNKVSKADIDAAKARLETEKKTQQNIINDESRSTDEKIEARWRYHNAVNAIVDLDKWAQINAEKEVNEENKRQIKESLVDSRRKRELLELEEQRHRGRVNEIVNQANEEQKQSVDKYVTDSNKDIRDADEETTRQRIENEKKVQQAKEEAHREELKRFNERLSIAQGAAQVLFQFARIGDAIYDRKIAKQQEYLDEIDQMKEVEIAAINATGMAEQQKIEARNEVEARYTVERINRENQIRATQRQKAAFEKALTISEIIAETALAAVRALGMKPYTPYNVVQAEIVSALGAAKLATAIAAPLPQFYKGTKYSPEGLAVVGEQGRELRVNPDGSVELTPGNASVTYLKQGTQIIPNQETEDILSLVKFDMFDSFYSKRETDRELAWAIEQATERSTEKIVRAIKNTSERTTQTDKSFYDNYYFPKFKN